MNLAAPLFLAALALALPIVITFLVRRRHRVIRVPSTIVWRLGAKSVAKNRRVRDLRRVLALLACLLGVAALVVAAAQPSGKRSDAVVYVVDVSATMAGAPIRDARIWLGRDIAARGPRARIAIILAGAEPKVALSPSPPGPLVDAALSSIAAGSDIASIDEAVSLAEALAGPTMARVVVLSDRPIEAEVSRRVVRPEQHVFSRGEDKPDNVGITSLFTRTSPEAHDDEEREATVTVATSSWTSRRARLVVTLAGRVVADRKIEIPARGEATERVAIRSAGRLVARVTPEDGKRDVLALDDEASLDEAARRPPHVALIREGGESGASFFVEKALRAAGVTDLTEANADGPAPSSAEIAVVMRDGSARPRDVPAFYIGTQPKDLELTIRNVDRNGTHLRSIATEDPMLRGVALDDTTILRAQVMTPPRGARTLVDLDAGPVLVAGGTGSTSWVWLGVEPEASDLVLRVAFPVLVGNVLAHLGGAAQIVTAKTVPRSEVMFESPPVGPTLPEASEPRWRLPASPPATLAAIGALLLALEAWLSFRKRWAT